MWVAGGPFKMLRCPEETKCYGEVVGPQMKLDVGGVGGPIENIVLKTVYQSGTVLLLVTNPHYFK